MPITHWQPAGRSAPGTSAARDWDGAGRTQSGRLTALCWGGEVQPTPCVFDSRSAL